jgi:hypothetical protein
MSLGAPTVHKDLSLISLVRKWLGSESTNFLEEFISTLEASARIDKWEPKDTLKLAASKVADHACSLFNLCPKFHGNKISWQKFEMTHRYRSKARQRRRGRTRNSPEKGNPRERLRSHESRSKPGYYLSCAIVD